MADPRLNAALDLMRRMPPSRMESSLEELVDLAPDLTDDLLNTVDQPLQVAKDAQGNAYLLCDYNRDGDSYRSPWTNAYDPPIDDGVLPPDHLRELEEHANDVFKAYLDMYYVGGCSSAYFWELDDDAFAVCALFKKDVDSKKKGLESGGWDAIHVCEVRPQGGGKARYKLTSTVILSLATDHTAGVVGSSGELKLSGSMTRQKEQELQGGNSAAHLTNIGTMIEAMENSMWDSLKDVYFGKTKNTVNRLYKQEGSSLDSTKAALAKDLQNEMGRRQGE